MSFDPEQFRVIIRETLTIAGLGYSLRSEELLFAIAAHESHLGKNLYQINGPACGVFQMEPDTEIDTWLHFINHRPYLKKSVLLCSGVTHNSNWYLKTNIAYQIVMARIHFFRVPEPLPPENAINEIALYWKKYWNTYLGKGTIAKFKDDYMRFAQ